MQEMFCKISKLRDSRGGKNPKIFQRKTQLTYTWMETTLAWGFLPASLEARGQQCMTFKVSQENDFETKYCV